MASARRSALLRNVAPTQTGQSHFSSSDTLRLRAPSRHARGKSVADAVDYFIHLVHGRSRLGDAEQQDVLTAAGTDVGSDTFETTDNYTINSGGHSLLPILHDKRRAGKQRECRRFGQYYV